MPSSAHDKHRKYATNAEQQKAYRERKRQREEELARRVPEPPQPDVPDGAWMTSNGFLRSRDGHYEAVDGTFHPIPDDVKAATMTTADGEVMPLDEPQQKRMARGHSHISDDRSVLFSQ